MRRSCWHSRTSGRTARRHPSGSAADDPGRATGPVLARPSSMSDLAPRWVCLDVGETLIDETRVWSVWAETLGIPTMTFLAAFGAVVDRGLDHASVFDVLGVPDWE